MQRPIDPVSLQHFVAVCEEGNIARAADRESLVASALSKRIAALEASPSIRRFGSASTRRAWRCCPERPRPTCITVGAA